MKTLLSLFAILLLAIALPAVPLYGDSGSDDQSSGQSGKSGSGGSDDSDSSGSGSSGRNGADDPADQPDDNGGQRNGDQAEDNSTGDRSGDDHSSNSGPSQGSSSGPGNGHNDQLRNACADDRQGQPGDETTLTRMRRALEATPAGQAIFAKGYVELRFIGPREKFKVEVEAMAPEGTTFLVLANGLAVGTVRIQFGEGELELSNEDGRVLPEALRPLNAVSRVEVVNESGMVILSRQL
jgi:hypothetical protein